MIEYDPYYDSIEWISVVCVWNPIESDYLEWWMSTLSINVILVSLHLDL